MFVHRAIAIGEVKVCVRHAFDTRFRLVDVGPNQNLFGVAAVGSGVHVNRTPYRTRYAGRELEARKALTRSRVGQDWVEDPCIGDHVLAGYLDVREHAGKSYGEAPYAAVEDENIRASAQDRHGNAVLAGALDSSYQLVSARRLQESVGRTPDLPGCVASQGLV